MSYRTLAIVAGVCFIAGTALGYALRPRPAAPGPDLSAVVDALRAAAQEARAEADRLTIEARELQKEAQEARRRAERVFPPLPIPETASQGAAALQGIGVVASAMPCGLVLDLPSVPVIQGLHQEAGRVPAFREALAAAEGRGDRLEAALAARAREVVAKDNELRVCGAQVAVERQGREQAQVELKSAKRWGPVKVGVGVAVGAGAAWGISRLVK